MSKRENELNGIKDLVLQKKVLLNLNSKYEILSKENSGEQHGKQVEQQ